MSGMLAGAGAGAGGGAAPRSAEAGDTRDSVVLRRIAVNRLLRVCIWPEYYGISYRHPRDGRLSGIDVDLSAELARELGVQIRYVESSFPSLMADLEEERCDVAMFAVAISPERKARLDFTQPYLASDIYGVTTRGNRTVRQWADIDRRGVVVAVQAGTLVETVMRDSLKQARLLVVQPPTTREAELSSGRADVFMADYPYSRRLLDNADWARVVAPEKPFHVLSYAYAVKRGDAAWLGRMNSFVTAIKHDGRLQAAAERHSLSRIVVP
ncbi:ABC transporter substrate-binding protein [Roseateles sp. YR242]|uniref:ABC transporter substrate-binding protein n=1 Tax=Roseateles sp. YR242 TaxID=1855305 RepID=UPI000B835EF8